MGMPQSYLTGLAFDLNSKLDEGARLDFDETCKALEERRAIAYMTANGIDASLIASDPNFVSEVNTKMEDLFNGIGPSRLRRKLGVEHNGYALLLAFVLELIQQRQR